MQTLFVMSFLWLFVVQNVANAEAQPPLRVLFLGNSYTSVNDLPSMIVGLAEAAGGRRIEADRHLVGGCTFERHVKERKAIEKIGQKKWDVVVLQEQSLRPVTDRDLMFQYARILYEETSKQGAKTVFYLTWARQNAPEMQDGISDAYLVIAKELGAEVAPVGVAWKKALAADKNLVLHQADKSHPTPTGSYLGACVFYATLFGKSPVGLPGEIKKNGKFLVQMPPEEAKRLQEIAWQTVQETKQRRSVTYTNPVGDTPLHMGDPFVLQHGGRYYLVGTTSANEGFKCWESTDLVHWSPKGWAYQKTDNSWAKSHYWAPEVKEYRGKFYMTYSAMSKTIQPPRLLIALAVSDQPEGPYRDLHAPWFDFGYSAIDGHIFVDDDGKPYLYFSRNGAQDGYSFGIVYGVALADDLSKPSGEAVKLMEADQPWEKVRYDKNRCNEGSFVLKHKGRYYMTYSANSTAWPQYGIGYATADKPLGPWVKANENPIAATNLEIGVSGPGHNSTTWSPDGKQMFIVYHTHADPKKPSGSRVVNIDRLYFDESGQLRIKGPTRSPQPMPSGCP